MGEFGGWNKRWKGFTGVGTTEKEVVGDEKKRLISLHGNSVSIPLMHCKTVFLLICDFLFF
jgi:hypothetical protein